MRFVIDRKKWLRGVGGTISALNMPRTGKQCCVGQMCVQLGVPKPKLRGATTVSDLGSEITARLKPLWNKSLGIEKMWVGIAYAINDDELIDDKLRERRLKSAANHAGHKLVFKN